jgi:hypothetical protein
MNRAALAAAVLLALFPAAAGAREPVTLTASPRELSGVAGEPLVLTLEVRLDHAADVRLKLPPDPLLHLRATETDPVSPAPGGGVIFRKRLLWQGLEPGETTLDGITVDIDGTPHRFPAVRVNIVPPEAPR